MVPVNAMETLFRMVTVDGIGTSTGSSLPRCRSRVSKVGLRSWLLGGILVGVAASGQVSYCVTPASASAASATSINGADVEVNGARMASGATLFPGDVVQIGMDSSAALQFGK